MGKKLVACANRFPPLSTNYPWLVAQSLDGTGDQTFYTLHDQLYRYTCRKPELLGKLIRGHSHGWVILSNKNMWSLWNPVTSKIIDLPRLILSNSESVGQCCLSSPPDDPTSVLLLTISRERTFVLCRLGFRLDSLKWTRRPYNRQLKKIIGHYHGFLECPTSYKGKIYALCNKGEVVIQVDIIVKDAQVLVQLLLFARHPYHFDTHFPISIPLLKGSCTQLFFIRVAFNQVTSLGGVTRKTLGNVYLFKWVMTSMRWEVIVNLKGAVFFVNLSGDYSIYYNNHAIVSELGGYIHICDEMGKMLYSYDVEDKTISLSSMAYPTSHVSLWECRLDGNDEDSVLTFDSGKIEDKNGKIDVRSTTFEKVELNESQLLNLPFHVLEMIMDHCIGVEYMCIRATCKRCYLAAPLIQWSEKTTLRRLHKYSLISPWLMLVDKNKGIINLTDPMFGDKYYMKRSQVLINCNKILCSRFGWLLFYSSASILLFFNPFTSEIRKLPHLYLDLYSLCFSAPPTSPNCMVVGFYTRNLDVRVCIHLAREQTWRMIQLDFCGAPPPHFCSPTFCGRDLYVLCDKGEVYVLNNLPKFQRYNFKKVGGERIGEGDYFLVKRDQQFLLVVAGEYIVEVFKLNDDTKAWEKVYSLGRHMIYIGGTTCLCIEAQVPEMENKIFFPRLHSRDGNIVFYSLETCRYHMFSDKNVEEIVGVGRELVNPHAWIEPSWS